MYNFKIEYIYDYVRKCECTTEFADCHGKTNAISLSVFTNKLASLWQYRYRLIAATATTEFPSLISLTKSREWDCYRGRVFHGVTYFRIIIARCMSLEVCAYHDTTIRQHTMRGNKSKCSYYYESQ